MTEYVGQWCTPSVPDDKLLGTLTVTAQGSPSLRLLSDHRSAPDGSLRAVVAPPRTLEGGRADITVIGQSHSGQLFTLFDGHIAEAERGRGGVAITTIDFGRGFIGAAIDNPNELAITEAYARFPGMDAWYGTRAYEISHQESRVDVVSRLPDDQLLEIDSERRFGITWTRSGPQDSVIQTKVSMRVEPWFGVEYSNPVSSEKALDDLGSVARLLSLVLGASTTPRRIQFRSPQHTWSTPTRTHMTALHVLGRFATLKHSFRKWCGLDVLLPLAQWHSDLEPVLQKWFKLHHDCSVPLIKYFAAQRSPSAFAEDRFFSFASVVESLHRHLSPSLRNFEPEEAKEIWRKIKPNIPSERRTDSKAHLRHVHELSYKQRLTQMMERVPALSMDAIGNTDEQQLFCRLVRDLRDNEAHLLHRGEEPHPGGLKYARIAAKLRAVIDACILTELGFSDSIIMESMRKCRRYWATASNATWPWNVADNS